MRRAGSWKLAVAIPVLAMLPCLAFVDTGVPPVPAQYQSEAPDQGASWSPTRAALGKRLFYDRRLSRDSTVSCADCHRPDLAFTDGKPTAMGMRGTVGPRNTPTVVNRALGNDQFWDGRARSLEEQALGPITNPGEMDMTSEEAVRRVASEDSYRRAFREAFGNDPTKEGIAQAIAAYERTIYSVDAPFDRFLAGDTSALSPAAQRGLKLFGGKARCGECHSGSNFTDELFHCLGLPRDKGRGGVTGIEKDVGLFKTPTLREVARTGPYMHDGSLGTLAEVIDLYDRGGEPHPNLDPKLKKLGLTSEEKADLVAFLEALSGRVIELQAPVKEDSR